MSREGSAGTTGGWARRSLPLAAALLAGVLTACGGAQEASDPTSDPELRSQLAFDIEKAAQVNLDWTNKQLAADPMIYPARVPPSRIAPGSGRCRLGPVPFRCTVEWEPGPDPTVSPVRQTFLVEEFDGDCWRAKPLVIELDELKLRERDAEVPSPELEGCLSTSGDGPIEPAQEDAGRQRGVPSRAQACDPVPGAGINGSDIVDLVSRGLDCEEAADVASAVYRKVSDPTVPETEISAAGFDCTIGTMSGGYRTECRSGDKTITFRPG